MMGLAMILAQMNQSDEAARGLMVLAITVGAVALVIGAQVAILRWIFRINQMVARQEEMCQLLGRILCTMEGQSGSQPVAGRSGSVFDGVARGP